MYLLNYGFLLIAMTTRWEWMYLYAENCCDETQQVVRIRIEDFKCPRKSLKYSFEHYSSIYINASRHGVFPRILLGF